MEANGAGALFRKVDRLPVLRTLAHAAYAQYFARAHGRQRLFRGVYPDFAAAERAAPHTKPHHYDDSGYGYAHSHQQVLSSDYPVMLWLNKLLGEAPSVLDFGGNVGMAFYGYRRYLQYPGELHWLVYDLPEIVAAGRRIHREEGAPGALAFASDLAQCQGCQLFLAAGSLQYVPETPARILARLSPLPRHLILNKLPVTSGPTFFTLQNTGTAFCPYRVMQRSELLESLASLGYQLEDDWANPDMTLFLPDAPERSLAAFSGMYLRAK